MELSCDKMINANRWCSELVSECFSQEMTDHLVVLAYVGFYSQSYPQFSLL